MTVHEEMVAEWFSPAFAENPYLTYSQARETPGLIRSVFGFWIATRAADVEFVLTDRRFGKRNRETLEALRGSAILKEPVYEMTGRMVINQDPPDHTRLRGLVNEAFQRTRMKALRPNIQQIVDDLLDGLLPLGRMDVVRDFAHPIPVAVICEILGIGKEHRPLFRRLTDALVPSSEAKVLTNAELREANRAALDAEAFFRSFCQARRDQGGQDVSSHLSRCAHGGRLSEAELSSNLILLFMAGHETTVNFLGNAVLTLHTYPAALAQLKADPASIPAAVEELLRYESSVQNIYRTALADVSVNGALVREGEMVLCMLGAANRDPAKYENAERLDICRRGSRHFSFGGGIHFCLGAALVRIEADIALSTLLRRIPNMELPDMANPQWKRNAQMRGLRTLPARWDVPMKSEDLP
jgi:cytochrome P450